MIMNLWDVPRRVHPFLFNRIRESKGLLENILRQFAQSLYDCVMKTRLFATYSRLNEARSGS